MTECTCGLRKKIEAELQLLESLHFEPDGANWVAGQIQLLKSILGHEYYK